MTSIHHVSGRCWKGLSRSWVKVEDQAETTANSVAREPVNRIQPKLAQILPLGGHGMIGFSRSEVKGQGHICTDVLSRLADAVLFGLFLSCLYVCSWLASCLIYARPLRLDRWLVGARFVDSWRPFLLLNQIFWKQCTIRQYTTPIYLINLLSKLG